MKIRTLILMAIVVILAGCSGSILRGSTEIDFPSIFTNITWTGEGYTAVFTNTGYTLTLPNDDGKVTNNSRYSGVSFNYTYPDKNKVWIDIYKSQPNSDEDSHICTDKFEISEDGKTLTIYMDRVYPDGSGVPVNYIINNAKLTKSND